MSGTPTFKLGLLVTSWLAAAPVAAWAQTAASLSPTTRSGQAAASAAPEEVVVTARRTAERIQSTPISVTAFTARTLRQKHILKTSDLRESTPGVFLSGSGARENSVFQIRGQSKSLSGFNAPAVASYFADVPQPSFGSSIDIYDMSNVQVLKGPQGTLFGRNTTGGAVLFYPQLPTYKTGGYLQTGYGNYNDRQVEGAVNLPLVADKVALRVAGQYDERDGYTRNIGTDGGYLDDNNVKTYRVSLRLDPVSWLHNDTIYDWYTNDYAGDGIVLTQVDKNTSLVDTFGVRAALNQQLALQQARGGLIVNSDIPDGNSNRRLGVTNHTDIDLGYGISFTNIFGYRRTSNRFYTNADGVPVLISSGNPAAGIPAGLPITFIDGGAVNNTEQVTDEVQLKGSVLHDKVRWLLGGFYLHSDPYGPTGTGNAVGDVVLPGERQKGFTTFNYNFYTEDSRAIFGNANIDLGDLLTGLRFDGGYRYTWDQESSCAATDNTTQGDLFPSQCLPTNPILITPSTNKASSNSPTWTVGLDWRINKALFAYIVSRRGYREGGINSPTFSGLLTPEQTFGAEKVTDFEIGLRTDYTLLGMKTRLNGSFFDGAYSGVQTALSGVQTRPGCIVGSPVFGKPPYSPDGDCNVNNDPATGTLLVNAGSSRVVGLDFDGSIAPTSHLTLSFSGSLLDPETTSYQVPSLLSAYATSNKIQFNFVTKASFTGGAQYLVDLGRDRGTLLFNANYYWTSRVTIQDGYLPPYGVANFRIDWNDIYKRPVDLSFYMTNAFDRRYAEGASVAGDSVGMVSVILGPPRQFGFQLRYRFGG